MSSSSSRPGSEHRWFCPALAIRFTLTTALMAALLTGCADSVTPTDPSSPSKSQSAAPEGSGSTATESIEGSVADAEHLLKELDQDFQEDDTQTN